MRTRKLPASPSTPSTSEYMRSFMLGWRPTPTILGLMVHMAQSPVGKVLSRRTMLPPMEGWRSTRYTLKPLSARSRLACIPAIPAPMTRTEPTFSSLISRYVGALLLPLLPRLLPLLVLEGVRFLHLGGVRFLCHLDIAHFLRRLDQLHP